MGYFLTDEEREALWGQEATRPEPWEPPEVALQRRIDRLESALRGILALSTNDLGALMAQAVAAGALGDYDLEARLIARIADRRRE